MFRIVRNVVKHPKEYLLQYRHVTERVVRVRLDFQSHPVA